MGNTKRYSWRLYVVFLFLLVALLGIIWRLIDLNIINRLFLLQQSKARILRNLKIFAHRGMIVDRLGMPFAISAPVDSVWVNPRIFQASPQQIRWLAHIISCSPTFIRQHTKKIPGREFIYLERGLPPFLVEKIEALRIQGIFFQREYKRYYPEGEVAAHIVGLTNIDDRGQEGIELAYDQWLTGTDGVEEVLKDRLGQVVADVGLLKKPKEGHTLVMSIDHRIQYLAYRCLKAATKKYDADSGSIVVLNVKTGEILAMVNQPSYNPNERPKDQDGRYRNRAVTDTFEPGSVIKPFNIVLALESGKYTPNSIINTRPGWMRIGGYKIKDELDYGIINLTQVLQKSSNIGAAKIMLSLQPQEYYDLLRQFGFGQRTQSDFPGEASGVLPPRDVWYPSVVATLAYGYGMAVTTLQLAHAYAILGNGGIDVPVTFLKLKQIPKGSRIIRLGVANTLVRMLETVVETGGTGTKAQVPGYRVAGKTGTAYIAGPNGYNKNKYMSSFVGIAPVSNPQLVIAVTIREPKGQHFGGEVAAPVFSKVMEGTLRILNITPDNLGSNHD